MIGSMGVEWRSQSIYTQECVQGSSNAMKAPEGPSCGQDQQDGLSLLDADYHRWSSCHDQANTPLCEPQGSQEQFIASSNPLHSYRPDISTEAP